MMQNNAFLRVSADTKTWAILPQFVRFSAKTFAYRRFTFACWQT